MKKWNCKIMWPYMGFFCKIMSCFIVTIRLTRAFRCLKSLVTVYTNGIKQYIVHSTVCAGAGQVTSSAFVFIVMSCDPYIHSPMTYWQQPQNILPRSRIQFNHEEYISWYLYNILLIIIFLVIFQTLPGIFYLLTSVPRASWDRECPYDTLRKFGVSRLRFRASHIFLILISTYYII